VERRLLNHPFGSVCVLVLSVKVTKVERLLGCSELYPLVPSNESGTIAWLLQFISLSFQVTKVERLLLFKSTKWERLLGSSDCFLSFKVTKVERSLLNHPFVSVRLLVLSFKVTKVERLLGCSELYPLVQSNESGTIAWSELCPLVQIYESGTIAWLLQLGWRGNRERKWNDCLVGVVSPCLNLRQWNDCLVAPTRMERKQRMMKRKRVKTQK
jgi:hypothetical protein